MLFRIPFTDHEERLPLKTKCTICKVPTDHEFIKIIPMVMDSDSADPMEVLKLSKRLSICTECGNMRLTN